MFPPILSISEIYYAWVKNILGGTTLQSPLLGVTNRREKVAIFCQDKFNAFHDTSGRPPILIFPPKRDNHPVLFASLHLLGKEPKQETAPEKVRKFNQAKL